MKQDKLAKMRQKPVFQEKIFKQTWRKCHLDKGKTNEEESNTCRLDQRGKKEQKNKYYDA